MVTLSRSSSSDSCVCVSVTKDLPVVDDYPPERLVGLPTQAEHRYQLRAAHSYECPLLQLLHAQRRSACTRQSSRNSRQASSSAAHLRRAVCCAITVCCTTV
jgi:hypothetical protein